VSVASRATVSVASSATVSVADDTDDWDHVIMHYHVITFCMSGRRRKMYCGHACLCVCLSLCVSVHGHMPTLLHGPGCNLGRDRGCPLVVHYWADLQSVHGLHCYGNIMQTLATSLRPSRDMTT